MAFFSIIIPTLNEEHYLPLLLKDLSQQSFKDFEVIVVDGNSEDRTIEKAASFSSLLPQIYITTSKKRNVGHQRNLGAKKSTGKYYFFLDADNRLPAYYLEGVHYQLLRFGYVFCTTWAEADSSNSKDKLLVRTENAIIETGAVLKFPLLVFGASLCIEKNEFEHLSGFDETVRWAEDYDLVKRAIKNGLEFKVLHDPTFVVSLRRFRNEHTLNMYRSLLPKAFKVWFLNGKVTEELAAYQMTENIPRDPSLSEPSSEWELKQLLVQLKDLSQQQGSKVRSVVRKIKQRIEM